MPASDASSLILASASPRRQELLGLLRLPFEVIPSAYDEVMPERHPEPEELALELAREKALDVARRYPGAVVVGADTIVVLNDRLYGKPKDPADAVRMLTELSGRTHRVITAVAVVDGRMPGAEPNSTDPQLRVHSFAVSTDVTFRALSREEIEEYVATGEPLDKAGAYGIQAYGALLIEGIRGDYWNVMGLPVAPLALLLRRLELSPPVAGSPS